ncbi:MAG: S-layer homology domain-containing protein [Candidatus Peregrinibacteria bacterium]
MHAGLQSARALIDASLVVTFPAAMSLRSSLLCALGGILLLAVFSPLTAFASFSDVSPTHPYATAIEYIQEQGIVQGYPNGTFRPDATINRAEFVKMILLAVSSYDYSTADCAKSSVFSDVPQGAWFNPYVCVAKNRRYVSGYPDGTFHPNVSISFVEAAKIIVNALEVATDAGHTLPLSPWYRPFVTDLEASYAIPLTITSFDHLLTRGEMAEILYRLEKQMPQGITTLTKFPSRTYEELTRSSPGVGKNLSFYQNVKYGYQLTFSADRLELLALDNEKPAIEESSPTSDLIMIRSLAPGPLMLQILGVQTDDLPRYWLETEIGKKDFMNGGFDMGQSLQWIKDTTFAGLPAVEARGESRDGSLFRIVVLRSSDHLLILTQSVESPLLQSVMDSVKITNSSNPELNDKFPAFDSCASVISYARHSWYPAFLRSSIAGGMPPDVNGVISFGQGCLSLDGKTFLALWSGGYCGGTKLLRYDVTADRIDVAKNVFDQPCAQFDEFGKRRGPIIPITGAAGDAGCSSKFFFVFDLLKNEVRLTKTESKCWDDPAP